MANVYTGKIFIDMVDFWTFLSAISNDDQSESLEKYVGKLNLKFTKSDFELHVNNVIILSYDLVTFWEFVQQYMPNPGHENYCGVPKINEEEIEINFFATSETLEAYPDLYKKIEAEWEEL